MHLRRARQERFLEARLHGRLGHGEVHVVGGRDRDEVDPPVGGQRLLLREQFGIGAVGPGGIDGVVGGAGLGAFRVAGKGAGHEFGPVIEYGGRHVHAADKGALSPAHDPHPQFSAQRAVCGHGVVLLL